MSSDRDSLTDKNETLLLENVDTVVKLLNSFGEKRHISSQNVVARLIYLYNRLTDFLSMNDSSDEDTKSGAGSEEREDSKKVSVSTSSPESKCDICHNTIIIYNSDYDLSMTLHIQQFREQHSMALRNSVKNVVDEVSKIGIGEQGINRNQSSKIKSDIVNSATGISVVESDHLAPVECGICKQYIPIKNSDYNLSMALHVRDDFHQITVDLEKKAIQEAKQLIDPLKQLGINLGHYITYSDATKYYCELCKTFMTGIDNAKEHITGSSHNVKIAKKAQDSQIIILSNGIYFCKLCNAPLGSSSNALDHKIGEKHRKSLAAKEMSENTRKLELEQLMTEDRIWLRNPSTAAAHRMFFKNLSETIMYCILCETQVPKTEFNILSHIRGRQHSRSFSDLQVHRI